MLLQGASDLSSFFNKHISEISTYSRTPLLKSMNRNEIILYLKQTISFNGDYAKFTIGLPSSYYYNTAGGNKYKGGMQTVDNTKRNAELMSLKKRDYWQRTIGKNKKIQQIAYVSKKISDPIVALSVSAGKNIKGDWGLGVENYTQDEVGHLTKTYNTMSETLLKKTKDLTDSSNQLQDIIQNIPGIVFQLILKANNT